MAVVEDMANLKGNILGNNAETTIRLRHALDTPHSHWHGMEAGRTSFGEHHYYGVTAITLTSRVPPLLCSCLSTVPITVAAPRYEVWAPKSSIIVPPLESLKG